MTASKIQDRPRVVIVGAGFAGLSVARGLRRSPVDVTVLDRRNYHLFQPLLYQVATASLSPADIAAPIRRVLSKQRNTRVLLGEAVAVDTAARSLRLRDGTLGYDFLCLCCGVTHSYFGHDSWAADAPGLTFFVGDRSIISGIYVSEQEAPLILAQWRQKARDTFVSDSMNAARLVEWLLDLKITENAALVQQSAAAAQELKHQAQRLVSAVAVFKLASAEAALTS